MWEKGERDWSLLFCLIFPFLHQNKAKRGIFARILCTPFSGQNIQQICVCEESERDKEIDGQKETKRERGSLMISNHHFPFHSLLQTRSKNQVAKHLKRFISKSLPLCYGIRWPLFSYLHHYSQSLIIIFVQHNS